MIFGQKTGIVLAAFLLAAVSGLMFAEEQAANATRRMGLFIGSNNGGRGRVMLRYAVADARTVSRVFGDMGGIVRTDNTLLVEPTVTDINRRLDALGRELASARKSSQRTELVFYYSGHSDEDGLLLNRERYSYRDLRERINRMDTDMRIVILDSCSSGAITRAKGGVKTLPFLFDSSVSVEGYAFLTSSSADEASQESDAIESSYFTHSLVAGLRGAADTVGDGRVTLNELYRFAYAETLAKTETSVFGAQHPSYDMQVSGSGDVILTDIKETSASLLIGAELTGRISIRDSSDFLVAELTKVNQKPMELGLEPGLYRITIQKGNNFYRAEIFLAENNRSSLTMADFSQIASASGSRNRGPENTAASEESEVSGDAPVHPVNIQLLPGFELPYYDGEKATNNFLLGLFVGVGHNIYGMGAASLGLANSGYVRGVQASGFFNTAGAYVEGVQAAGLFNAAGGRLDGVQASGIFNIARVGVIGGGVQASGFFNLSGGNVTGVQTAGFVNYSRGELLGVQISGLFNRAQDMNGLQAGLVNISGEGKGRGLQLGLVNISGSENTLPVGLVNVVKGGMIHPSIYVDDMMFLNAGFRSGTKHFYTHLSAGVNRGFLPRSDEDRLAMGKAGFGFEFPIKKFFIDIDVSAGQIINIDKLDTGKFPNLKNSDADDWKAIERTVNDSITGICQLRLTGGYKIFEHLGVFAGVSYDYLYAMKNGNVPEGSGGFLAGGTFGRHAHKLGLFGGIQF